MSVAIVLLILLACVLVAGAGVFATRRVALRRRFGAEYDRLARDVGPRRARAEIAQRQRRVAGLGLKPLSADQVARYDSQWNTAQARFIDSPAESVRNAAGLVTGVASDRGYQVTDADQFMTDLSVHHARRLDGYRQAQRATERASGAATEELRQALLAHRAIFRELLGTGTSRSARSSRTRQLSRSTRTWRRRLTGFGRSPRRRPPDRLPALRGER
jgi:hypothetical protein